MKITRILAYRVELPLHEGSYKWSGGKSVSVFDSTIVAVETDEGITGHGEVCPLGPFYLPAYAAGARTGIAELGPHLLGEDPRQLGKLNRRMDAGACRDIRTSSRRSTSPAGTSSARRRASRSASCWAGVTARTSSCIARSRRSRPRRWPRRVAGYRAEGYRRFQLKVGGDPMVDIERIRPVAARAAARRPAGRRRQYRLADARRPARRPRRARRRRLHRAALPELRGMPHRPPRTATIPSCSTR